MKMSVLYLRVTFSWQAISFKARFYCYVIDNISAASTLQS